MLRLPPALWLLGLAVGVSHAPQEPSLEHGDLVFQISTSAQSGAIQAAQGSAWTHVGIVEQAADGTFVVEAEGKVVRTPWARFRARGAGGEVLVLRARDLDGPARAAVVAAARRELGEPYDARFGWGDDALYCSELVVKAFERGAGLHLGRPVPLGELDLRGLEPALRARFGGAPPLGQLVVTPASLVEDPALAQVSRE
jgi:hypothetical protein